MKWQKGKNMSTVESGLSPEYQLLVRCASISKREQLIPAIGPLLEKPLNWEQILGLASWHRLSALLLRNLHQSGLDSRVPHQIIQHLEGVYHNNFARNMYFQSELGKALQALQAQGIPAIVLKGAALAETVYQDFGLRPMGDLDVLVKEHHLDQADDLIRTLGYTSNASANSLQRTREEHRHYPTLFSADDIVAFEIHRHIVRPESPLYFDLTSFWARACPITIAGAKAYIPAPEDLLTHLCIHFFLDRRHQSCGALGQLCDISETVKRYRNTLNWDLFIDQAHQHNLVGPLHCTLFLVRELLETSPPERVLRDLKPTSFSLDMVEKFIKRRVLGVRPWPTHELVSPRSRYTSPNLIKSALRRVFPEASSLAEKYDQCGHSKWSLGLYLHRIFQVTQLLSRYMWRPRELRQDLRLERWFHSLYGLDDNAST